MKRYTLPLLLLAALLLSACSMSVSLPDLKVVNGSGKAATETRSLGDFKSVELTGSGDLEIILGGENSIEISADDNLLSYIETRVEGGVLYIGFKPNSSVLPRSPIRFTLSAKTVENVALSGSGDLRAATLSPGSNRLDISGSGNAHLDALKTGDLRLSISGSGKMLLGELTAGELDVNLSGAGNVEIGAGEVSSQKVETSGSGSYQAEGLKSKAARVSIGGAGRAILWAEESLDVTISGSGSVKYRGQPKVTSSISGSGTLNTLQ